MIPGIGTLTGGLTGGAATATGGRSDGSIAGSGISSPVVIGGYKTDGSAGAVLPSWFVPAALVAVAGFSALFLWKKWRH